MAEALTWPDVLSTLLAGRDLSVYESTWAMRQVMRGQATEAQLAGFLVGLRAKGETIDEVVGFRDAILGQPCRSRSPRTSSTSSARAATASAP